MRLGRDGIGWSAFAPCGPSVLALLFFWRVDGYALDGGRRFAVLKC